MVMNNDRPGGSTSTNPFATVLERFKACLTRDQQAGFAWATFDDLRREILIIQEQQDGQHSLMNLTRIEPFIDGMEDLDAVLRSFTDDAQVTELMAFIWGPTTWLFKSASVDEHAFDRLLDAYQKLGAELVPFQECEPLFQKTPDTRICLANLYADLLRFQTVVLKVFGRASWQKTFRPSWLDLTPIFETLAESMRLHGSLVDSLACRTQARSSPVPGAPSSSRDGVSPENQLSVSKHMEQYGSWLSSLWSAFYRKESDRRQRQRSEVLAWIAASPLTEHLHADHCRTRNVCPGTGNWLLERPEIRSWLGASDPTHSVLSVTGRPGTGKTILSSLLVQECERIRSKDEESAVTYFYCQRGDPNLSTALSIAKGILHQILVSQEDLIPAFADTARNSGQLTLDRGETARQLLALCLENRLKQYIVIDGLDACDVVEAKRITLFLTGISRRCAEEGGRVQVLFTCCPTPDWKKLFDEVRMLELQPIDHVHDIRRYVQTRLAGAKDKDTQQFAADGAQVANQVANQSGGIFLHAYLIAEILLQHQPKDDMSLGAWDPLAPQSTGELYQRILWGIRARFFSSSGSHGKKALLLLSWLACAKRPLAWHEFQAVNLLVPEPAPLPYNSNQAWREVQEVCRPLLQVLPGQRVQMIHPSAIKGFLHSKYIEEPKQHCDLAILCLSYLSRPCFLASCSPQERQAEARQGHLALQDYVFAHWAEHLETVLRDCQVVFQDKDYEFAFDRALDDFLRAHRSGLQMQPDPNPPPEFFTHFSRYTFFSKLRLLCAHLFRRQRVDGSGELGDRVGISTIEKGFQANRHLLETFAASNAPADRDLVFSMYGRKIFKCNRLHCDSFYEGFETQSDRDQHLNRHDRPFPCPLAGCTQAPYGFSAKKDKERHIRLYHPEQTDQPPAFVQPTRRLEDARFICNICGKSFTRNINLKGHMRSHFGERPYACTTCGKAFTRLNDCRRHEKIHIKKSP